MQTVNLLDMRKKNIFLSLGIVLAGLFLSSPVPVPASSQVYTQTGDGPSITIWYGQEQTFGANGVPQPWVNILGNVSDPDGVEELSYRLNGNAEQPLSIGPDTLRLAHQGDFNIDIPISQLANGKNEIEIEALDSFDNQSVTTVTVNWSDGNQPLESVEINWASVDQIQSVAQVVDGLWQLDAEGVRPVELGYDRLIAIGDLSWQDYEVVIPITIHGAEPVFEAPSYGASVAIGLRWQGHRVWDETQPAYGWWPLGGSAAFVWVDEGRYEVSLGGNRAWAIDEDTEILDIEADVPYFIKFRVETLSPRSSLYSFKYWQSGEAEPENWQFQGEEKGWDPVNGSLLLLAHHVDVTFGDITVTQLQAISPWEWFELIGPYLTRLPILLIGIAALYWSLSNKSSWPTVWRPIFAAGILLITESLLGTFLVTELPYYLQVLGWQTRELGIVLTLVDVANSLLIAGALLLLGWAFLRRQKV